VPIVRLQDATEVKRWFEEGRTYAWMVEEYERKYNLQVTVSLFTHFRHRMGLPKRDVRDTSLVPWEVKREHRWSHPLAMLRAEARVRAGEPLAGRLNQKHASFMRKLEEQNLVVSYDPETPEGFHLVPREPGDEDIVRMPERGLLTKRNPQD
jgi:hypothetical protein